MQNNVFTKNPDLKVQEFNNLSEIFQWPDGGWVKGKTPKAGNFILEKEHNGNGLKINLRTLGGELIRPVKREEIGNFNLQNGNLVFSGSLAKQ